MPIAEFSATIQGRVAGNVRQLAIDGVIVPVDGDGVYRTTVPVADTERIVALTTTTVDGVVSTRLVLIGAAAPAAG